MFIWQSLQYWEAESDLNWLIDCLQVVSYKKSSKVKYLLKFMISFALSCFLSYVSSRFNCHIRS